MSNYWSEDNCSPSGELSEPLIDPILGIHDDDCHEAPDWAVTMVDKRVNALLALALKSMEPRLNEKVNRDEVDATCTLLRTIVEDFRKLRRDIKGESDAEIERRVAEACRGFEQQASTMREHIEALSRANEYLIKDRDVQIKAHEDRIKAIATRDETIRTQNEKIKTFEDEIKERDNEMRAMREALLLKKVEHELTIKTRDETIKVLEMRVKERENETRDMRAEIQALLLKKVEHELTLKTRDETIQVLEMSVKERDETIEARDKAIVNLRLETKEKEGRVNSRDEKIKVLEMLVKERDQTVEARDKEIVNLRLETKEKEGQVNSRDGKIAALEARVLASDEKIQGYEKPITSLGPRTAETTSSISNARERCLGIDSSKEASLPRGAHRTASASSPPTEAPETMPAPRSVQHSATTATSSNATKKRPGTKTAPNVSKRRKSNVSGSVDSSKSQITAQDIIDNPMTEEFMNVRSTYTSVAKFCQVNAKARGLTRAIVGAEKNRVYVCQSCSECRKDVTKAFLFSWRPESEGEGVLPGWADKLGTSKARYVLRKHLAEMERNGNVVVYPEGLLDFVSKEEP